MATEIRLPKLGETMEEGTIVSYLVKVGDKVKKGDVIYEVETDKATLEVESPAEGFVKEIVFDVGQTLPVNTPIMVLGEKDEKVTMSFIDSLKAEIKKKLETVNVDTPSEPDNPDLIEPQDLSSPDKTTISKIGLGQSIPLSRLQKITGRRMLQSKREIPCFYLSARVDVTELVAQRYQLNQTGDIRIAYHDFIIKATAIALQKYPIMSGRLSDDYIQLPKQINISLAIDVDGELVAPVVKNVGEKGPKQIATETAGLIEKAKNYKLSLTELEGGCITITNLGSLGIDTVIPVVMPGQCGILGIGSIKDTCTPDDAKFAIRKVMNLTLSADHRIANGAYAAQFLDYLRQLLQEPTKLV